MRHLPFHSERYFLAMLLSFIFILPTTGFCQSDQKPTEIGLTATVPSPTIPPKATQSPWPFKATWQYRFVIGIDGAVGDHRGFDIQNRVVSTQAYAEGAVTLGYEVYRRCYSTSNVCFRFQPLLGLGGGSYVSSQAPFFQATLGMGFQWDIGRIFSLGVDFGLGIKATDIGTVKEQDQAQIPEEVQQKPSDRVLAIGWIQPYIEFALYTPIKPGPKVSLRVGCKFQNGPAPLDYSYGSLDVSGLLGIRVRLHHP